MKENPLLKLQSFGQSIWLDFISRGRLDSRELLQLINEDGVSGVTSNPAIEEGVPAQILSAALYERFSSRGKADFADRVLSTMRYGFGGHLEKAAAKTGGI
jgi:6-phosphogluconate dehydrogenase (decarboxylating)